MPATAAAGLYRSDTSHESGYCSGQVSQKAASFSRAIPR